MMYIVLIKIMKKSHIIVRPIHSSSFSESKKNIKIKQIKKCPEDLKIEFKSHIEKFFTEFK